MSYSLDFSKITLEMFYGYLDKKRLFQSHQVLKEDINENLRRLKILGYHDIDTLYKDIKSQKKVNLFCEKHNYDLEYVTILRRHIISLVTKNRKITDFIRMDEATMEYLLFIGIKTTKELFERFDEVYCEDMEYLESIRDLVRMRYLHATFLDGLYFSGYKSIEDLASADYHEVSRRVNQTMIQKGISKAKLGLKDSEYLVEDAKLYLEWLSL